MVHVADPPPEPEPELVDEVVPVVEPLPVPLELVTPLPDPEASELVVSVPVSVLEHAANWQTVNVTQTPIPSVFQAIMRRGYHVMRRRCAADAIVRRRPKDAFP